MIQPVRSPARRGHGSRKGVQEKKWGRIRGEKFLNFYLLGREQNETAGGNKMRLQFRTHFLARWERLETLGFPRRIGVVAPSVGEGGRAAATGFRVTARVAAGRHRVTDSPRPRQQARPGLSIRKPPNNLGPSILVQNRCLILFPQQVSF